MIHCRGLRKCYRLGEREICALAGADLDLSEPGFYAVMGASGSGKSTLLHLLAALDRPDAGEITVVGNRLDSMTERDLTRFRREQVGVVFQQFNLIPTLSARENIELPGLLAGKSAAWRRERCEELMEALGLAHRADHRPDALSGGEQQRVAIARALLFSPNVLFADEPTGNLDSESSDALWSLLGQLARQHEMMILMVTHEAAAAIHCREVFVLRDGAIAGRFQTEGLDASGVATCYQQFGR